MARPVVAIVTGFVRNGMILDHALSPLRALKRKGAIDSILYLTWDTAQINPFVAPVEAMPEIECVRVPQPALAGAAEAKGLGYQLRSFAAALERVPEKDALIVKLRPDFIVDEDFLARKIAAFDTVCAPSTLGESFGVAMPRSPFRMKIWLPWADANTPFFCEDAAFMGLKRDVAKLADLSIERRLSVLAEKNVGWYVHVVRYAAPFLDSYPIFDRYLREFRWFVSDVEFRGVQLPALLAEGFFWHLALANAWILATSFHIDCGEAADLVFYANNINPAANWASLKTLQVNPPYDAVESWRAGHPPGGMMPGVGRIYGRLTDDTWQHSLFSGAPLRDLKPDQIRDVLRNVTLYRKGVLADDERAFYARAAKLHAEHWLSRAA